MTLSELVSLATKRSASDFWLVRRGTVDAVGRPVKEYNPEHIGVLVTRPEILAPQYLFYLLEHLHGTGYWLTRAHGTTRLVNITSSDVKKISLR